MREFFDGVKVVATIVFGVITIGCLVVFGWQPVRYYADRWERYWCFERPLTWYEYNTGYPREKTGWSTCPVKKEEAK